MTREALPAARGRDWRVTRASGQGDVVKSYTLVGVALFLCACGPVVSDDSHVIHVVWADGVHAYETPACSGVVLPPYTGDRMAPLVRLREWLAPFDVVVIDRDASESVDMTSWRTAIVVTTAGSETCGQGGRRGSTVIASGGAWINVWTDNLDPTGDAYTMAHELGHAIGGLDHVDEPGQIMAPRLQLDLPPVYDNVWRTSVNGSPQNAYQAMLASLGPSLEPPGEPSRPATGADAP